jgi:hypothetical protein
MKLKTRYLISSLFALGVPLATHARETAPAQEDVFKLDRP